MTVPPLRERCDEIVPLAKRILAAKAKSMGLRPPVLEDGAATRLTDHPWPGNVRELENLLARALRQTQGGAIAAEVIDRLLANKPADAMPPPPPLPPLLKWNEFKAWHQRSKREWALQWLARAGNPTEAAQRTGCPRSTFVNALKARTTPEE